ncbi:PucR family transcriptional regulator [Actinokineospora iranica]|uniref:PucR C-terminal helix-turn-helix domain-containing protein n=1 Tax=Actinokineospora iranica TaxID=1271860 RepID=A0A1G6YSS9_9PSEU|nr:helix-turn-helix domain-containing protein [Actinokineospora iranica]SDD93459.1 PucR C-terminal helix-turn-helix domain-containing protein [Actinokineospora iranica]
MSSEPRRSPGPVRPGGQVAPLRLASRDGEPTRPGQARGASAARELWASIPAELSAQMRPMAAELVRDVVGEIQAAVPAYAGPLEGKLREILVGSVEMAIVKCFENMRDPRATEAHWEAAFRYAGRVEFIEGRTMDALQTAVRVGSRVVWRRMSVVGRAMGVPADTLFAIADKVFAYVDELCTIAIAGYTDAQGHATGALERRRRQLLKLILADPPAAPQAIADLASTTDWVLPERVAVVALEYRDDLNHRGVSHRDGQHRLPAFALAGQVLVDLESADPCLVVADPDQHMPGLAGELRGRRAAIGPTVPLAQAHRSLACARRAMVLAQRGVLPDQEVIRCADHLSALVLLSDEFLLTQLTVRTLEPFRALTTKQRDRLTATLLAWLETRGGINEIAARLDVHPQTVRYRMHQIDELLGDRLNDPQERLCMEIALRARTLLDPDLPVPRDSAGDPDDEDEPVAHAR